MATARPAGSTFRQCRVGAFARLTAMARRSQHDGRRTTVEPSPDPLETAWSVLLTHWDETPRHRAFVELAQSLDRLPEAAKRYRDAKTDEALADGARKGLDQILAVAMASLTPAALAPRRPSRAVWLLPVVLSGLVVIATVMVAQVARLPKLASPVSLGLEIVIVFLLPWKRWTTPR